MFDCIIVGAGPGGATSAYHLAKKGYSVLVLEKASLPRYKPCGGGVSPAIAQWFDFDFTPVIDNTVKEVQYTFKMDDPVTSKLKKVEPMWMVRRDTFDQFLMNQATQAGAELKDNTEVTGIKFEGDSYQVNTANGSFACRYLIAADGVTGPMAQWLGLGERQEFFGASLEVETEVPSDQKNTAFFDFGSVNNGFIWCFPKSNGYSISAGIMRPKKSKPEEIKKQVTNYANKLGLDLKNSEYTEYPLSLWTESLPLHTNNALLVGEAAGILDPLIGEGIRPSILTGCKAAEAIEGALQGKPEALANYTEVVTEEWGKDMVLAARLAGLFYQFPKIAYKVGVKKPTAAQIMGQILCGELRYSDVTEQAVQKLKKSLIPGMG